MRPRLALRATFISMQLLFRVIRSFGWHFALSILSFYACVFVGEFVQKMGRGDYHTPAPWKFSIALCVCAFCLLAIALAAASQFRSPVRPSFLLAGACIIYTGTTLFLFGAFFGEFDRPYRLLFVLACGLSGLVTPWGLKWANTWRICRLPSVPMDQPTA